MPRGIPVGSKHGVPFTHGGVPSKQGIVRGVPKQGTGYPWKFKPPKCSAVKANGDQCGAARVRGKKICAGHLNAERRKRGDGS